MIAEQPMARVMPFGALTVAWTVSSDMWKLPSNPVKVQLVTRRPSMPP
ncbi:hypothetical protein SCANM63S_10254 [Streptomyces canarius]